MPISIHALREEGDPTPGKAWRGISYFYPRPPRGGRLVCDWKEKARDEFLSTPSARRATATVLGQNFVRLISIHALREEGDLKLLDCYIYQCISIHALREEGDRRRHLLYNGVHISIHALREEGDVYHDSKAVPDAVFLSTPSARRATAHTARLTAFGSLFLSTPSARRATCFLGCICP